MTTVRKTTKTTAVLIVLYVGIFLLMHWCETLPGKFFYEMESLLHSRTQIGGFHSVLIRLSFWILLITSGVDAVYRGTNGVYVFNSFSALIIFSICVAVWGLVAIAIQVNILWFWFFYYIGLIDCTRISYSRLSNIKGAGPSKINLLFKSFPSKNDSDISIIDRTVLYIAQIITLAIWLLLWISIIVFCIQYKQIFGL